MSKRRSVRLPSVGVVTSRSNLLLAMGLLLAVAGFFAPGTSTAAFTAGSRNAASNVTASPDWTPPTVSLQNPGSPVKDTVTLTAAASDGETGVKAVVISYLAPGASSWVDVCTATTAPYSCAWNTKALADGSYQLRARATDNAGYATTSDAVTTTVANTTLVTLGDPGEVVRGTVPLTTTIHNGGLLPYTVRVEYAVAGSGSWKQLCTSLTAPHTCSWNTTTLANDYYDLRSVATSGTTTYTSAVLADVLVDNLAPTVTMTDPGSPLSGTRTFEATASDAHSGIASVVLQYAATGSTTYRTLCTTTVAPYSCRVDTTTLPDGSYTLRAVATDVAGNATTSALVTSRVVDNTVSSVSMEDPGAFLTGTVALTASASSTAGVTSVRIQRAPSGTTTWTDVCTDTAAPYTCSWNTTTVADGLYDLRAVLLDGTGKVTTSATLGARRVDNAPFRGVDVQTANGGTSAGRLEAADTMTYTFSGQLNHGTVTSGWTGAALPVTVRVRDGNLYTPSRGNTGDTLEVLRNGVAVNLGQVVLRGEHVRSSRNVTFNATMTAGTVTVDGVVRSTVTLQLGTVVSGSSSIRTSSAGGTMSWTPSNLATDVVGMACSVAPVSETGALDREF